MDLCQGESGSGASLGVPARMSDRMCRPSGRPPASGVCSEMLCARHRYDPVVLSEVESACTGFSRQSASRRKAGKRGLEPCLPDSED